LAGFEVTLIGRFWVTPEDETALQTKIMAGTAKDKNANLLGKRL
jgi:hypothetical protein